MGFFNTVLNSAATVVNAPANLISRVTPPITSFALPDGYGSVTVWAAAFELHLTNQAVDELSNVGNFAGAVAIIVGRMVAGSGGALAPAAPFVAAYMTAQWAAIRIQASANGVKLKGMYLPPSGLIVPTPA